MRALPRCLRKKFQRSSLARGVATDAQQVGKSPAKAMGVQNLDQSEEGSSGGWVIAALVGFTAAGTAIASNERAAIPPSKSKLCMNVPWVLMLAADKELKLVLSGDSMSKHPLLGKNHMFSNLLDHHMVEDLVCFYSPSQKKLQYVIQLGRNICGFPGIMHGGLIAAIVDESFGYLWLSLQSSNKLSFTGPAFTAHLEVDYKKKIPAGKLLLCTTEVESCEGRKLWMTAKVTDGPSGDVYATARALFVRPRASKLLQDGVKIAYNYIKDL